MICPHCGENNPDNAKYCARCSATLPKKGKAGAPRKTSGGGIDPKTIIIIILAALLVIGAVVFVVSKISSSGDGDTIEEETKESEEETEEKTEEVTEEETEEETEKEEATTDWFDENGLVLSDPADSFSFKTMINDGEEDTEEVEVSSKVTITESTENQNLQDGYKTVTATFVYDISKSDGERGIIADGAFDRYTGTYFGFENDQPEAEDDNKADIDGYVRITNGSDHYDVLIKTDQEVNAPIIKKTITVVCPTDYDGTVFYTGYDSLTLNNKRNKLDFAEKLYTFDDLPFMDDDKEIFYFAYEKGAASAGSSWGTYEAEAESEETAVQPERH